MLTIGAIPADIAWAIMQNARNSTRDPSTRTRDRAGHRAPVRAMREGTRRSVPSPARRPLLRDVRGEGEGVLIDLWPVYEQLDGINGNREEIKAFRSLAAATNWAEDYSRRTGRETHIDWTLQEITRHGRECIESQADVAYFPGATP